MIEEMPAMPTEVVREVQRVILPIIATGTRDGSFIPVGTAFVIRASGRQALLLSAAHNFTHIAEKIDRPFDTHHPCTPQEFRVRSNGINLKETKIQALFRERNGGGYFAQILHTYINTPGDIAACFAHFEDDIPENVMFDKQLTIDTRPPTVGTPIIAAGYPSGLLHHHVDYENSIATATYNHKLEWRHGKVQEGLLEGARGRSWPSFRCNTPFDAGMSGGPIINKTYGNEVVACGVICSDWSESPSTITQGSGLSLASMLWTAMGIRIRNASLDDVDGPRLLDLQRKGHIDDRGKASDHIRIIPGASDDDFHMVYR
jgi:hypothetical protein